VALYIFVAKRQVLNPLFIYFLYLRIYLLYKYFIFIIINLLNSYLCLAVYSLV